MTDTWDFPIRPRPDTMSKWLHGPSGATFWITISDCLGRQHPGRLVDGVLLRACGNGLPQWWPLEAFRGEFEEVEL